MQENAFTFIFYSSDPFGMADECLLQELSSEIGGDYDVYAYIRGSGEFGAKGNAYDIGNICNENRQAVNFNAAYGPTECDKWEGTLECTPTNRIVLTAEVILYFLV